MYAVNLTPTGQLLKAAGSYLLNKWNNHGNKFLLALVILVSCWFLLDKCNRPTAPAVITKVDTFFDKSKLQAVQAKYDALVDSIRKTKPNKEVKRLITKAKQQADTIIVSNGTDEAVCLGLAKTVDSLYQENAVKDSGIVGLINMYDDALEAANSIIAEKDASIKTLQNKIVSRTSDINDLSKQLEKANKKNNRKYSLGVGVGYGVGYGGKLQPVIGFTLHRKILNF